MRSSYLLLVCMAPLVWASGARPVPAFQINLDLAPEDRFTAVVDHFETPLKSFYSHIVNNTVVLGVAKKMAAARGPENDELMGEIRGIAAALGWPAGVLQTFQLLYELQTLMVPVTNFSWPWLDKVETEALYDFVNQRPVSFGCTGIIARNEADGTVYHARNLDFSFAKYLQAMTYNAVFVRGGKELFTAQMVAAYQQILTGIRRGSDGYSFEVNTRFSGHLGKNSDLFKHLFIEKRNCSGWVKRKILESQPAFEGAVAAMSSSPYAATEYNIVSGVNKGVILARDPDGLAYKLELTDKNRYIIMTNFDYPWHDIKEWFDPTSIKGLGHSRRLDAQKILDNSDALTPELLFSVLNNDGVMAKDTIFQAIINVEKDLYNTSLPACLSCDDCVNHAQCRQESQTCCTLREHYTTACGTLGGFKCGCLTDGQCRFPRGNMTEGDEDCCSSQSHFSLGCPSTRKCGAK